MVIHRLPRFISSFFAAALVACSAGPTSTCVRVGPHCIAPTLFPRPIAPLSLGDVTLQRPTLRWSLAPDFDSVTLELCRDRSCTQIIESQRVAGTSARPSQPLPARSVVFWRVRGWVGTTESQINSATWLFHVPPRDATMGVDTSTHAHTDLNGDGYDDLVAGCSWRNSPSPTHPILVFYGSAQGFSSSPSLSVRDDGLWDFFGPRLYAGGDLNGDGFGELVIESLPGTNENRANPTRFFVYYGSAQGISSTNPFVLTSSTDSSFGYPFAALGDIDWDGYTELGVVTRHPTDPSTSTARSLQVFHGSSEGISWSRRTLVPGIFDGPTYSRTAFNVGDVDGNGFGDVFFSGLNRLFNESGSATAILFRGTIDGLSGITPTVITGAASTEVYEAVAFGVGDLNGDGYSDVGLTSGLDFVRHADEFGPRLSFHYGGPSGLSFDRVVGIPNTTQRLPSFTYLAASSDVNGDGFADAVRGLGGNCNQENIEGRLEVYLGSQDGVSSVAAATYVQQPPRCQFGTALTSLDANGDGYTDVVTSESTLGEDRIATDGTVLLYMGSPVGLSATPSWTWHGAYSYFGQRLAR